MVSKCLGVELKDDKILVLSMCPGFVWPANGPELRIVSEYGNLMTPEDAVSMLFNNFPKFNEQHTGGFYKRDMTVVPY